MKDFRSLQVWRKAHELALNDHRLTREFPKEELFGLTSQLRRAAYSVAANPAEGCGRGTDADFHRFAQMAMGSASELEYHLLLARDLELLSEPHHQMSEAGVVEVKRMLASLLKKLKADR